MKIQTKNSIILAGLVSKKNYKKIPTKDGGEFSILEFGIAANYNAETKKNEFVNCKVVGKLADMYKLMLTPHQYIVAGRLETESYINKNGEQIEKQVCHVDCITAGLWFDTTIQEEEQPTYDFVEYEQELPF